MPTTTRQSGQRWKARLLKSTTSFRIRGFTSRSRMRKACQRSGRWKEQAMEDSNGSASSAKTSRLVTPSKYVAICSETAPTAAFSGLLHRCMVIRHEAMASKEIGTAAAAGVNLRRVNLVFAKHEPAWSLPALAEKDEPFAIRSDVAGLFPDCVPGIVQRGAESGDSNPLAPCLEPFIASST